MTTYSNELLETIVKAINRYTSNYTDEVFELFFKDDSFLLSSTDPYSRINPLILSVRDGEMYYENIHEFTGVTFTNKDRVMDVLDTTTVEEMLLCHSL